jgi:hypothetical protein
MLSRSSCTRWLAMLHSSIGIRISVTHQV